MFYVLRSRLASVEGTLTHLGTFPPANADAMAAEATIRDVSTGHRTARAEADGVLHLSL